MDFSKIKDIYLLGIKGVGMSMLAQFLQAKGYHVFGSDIADTFPTDKTLRYAKIKYKSGFSLDNFPKNIDLVIHSSAYTPENNIEMAYFKEKKYKIMLYAEALGHFFNQHFGVAVCGSHGKTTVSAWLGFVLEKGGLSPNVLTGSYIRQFKGSALISSSKKFIIEADEYQNKFKYFYPQGVLLNNINFDHPDFFKSEKQYFDVFVKFIKKIPHQGFLITNAEDQLSLLAAQHNKGQNIFYSLAELKLDKKIKYQKFYQAQNLRMEKGKQVFDLYLSSSNLKSVKNLGTFKIFLPGRHNVLNSLAVIAGALELGLSLEKTRQALPLFLGAARRFDVLGEYRGATIIDDYAHHPVEVQAALQAVKQKYPGRRIVSIFHPHTFSRTKALMDDFAKSFSLCDDLSLVEIYSSAREVVDKKISSLDLIKKIKQYNQTSGRKQEIEYFASLDDVEKNFPKKIKVGDVVLLLGAGDIFRVAYKWLGIK